MYKEGSNVDSKFEKNKFEASISELKKKSFVSAADIESYGKLERSTAIIRKNEGYKIANITSTHLTVYVQHKYDETKFK